MHLASAVILIGGVVGFSSIAISSGEHAAAPVHEQPTATTTMNEISDGSVVDLGEGLSIAPIAGWSIQRKALGMSLVMKEVLPAQTGDVDYSKPIFARNLTVMTMPSARPIDEASVAELKAEIGNMFAKDSSLKDFAFTDHRFFDYKGKNDGLILFSQLTVNNYPMMQMQVIVSGEAKSYLMTYSDLASNFANPASYDAAWKSMTSIQVSGIAPKRYQRELMIGGGVVGVLLAIILPFFFVRWMNARRIRRFADELQHDWDTGASKSDLDYDLSQHEALSQTQTARKKSKAVAKGSKTKDFDLDVSAFSSVSACSTRHSQFA
jgi:hypothetical protein